ncbi:uncharacterized protein LOC122312562 [Carya illinoinensis]|uniref:uncharacterized protein LOC122312562 n=1 Tax=Carya illinoinensis TaxID=32201 RepID=UPI001C71B749|nr:uncharacterized protein LOC122312562 [Carya illinoinensis]
MRWHVEERVDEPNFMRHPADSRVWKDFDNKYEAFAQDPRNVRLALASDGFNPFNNMSKPYSKWPVLLVPYNLPTWSCMKDPYLMMSCLIPRPKAPRNDIDVFLRPLIDELRELWEDGIQTYDAYKGEMFLLRAALLWTINDFPAYANLSGWSTKGKSKGTVNARRDLEDLGLRKELHLQHHGNHTYMSLACYMLNVIERRSFCARMAEVKFPDGFASNITQCVNVNEGKIMGMKSHDCHIFMRYLLSVIIGGYLRPYIRGALIKLCSFFKELCSRTLDTRVLEQLQANIPIILCKLEMIFLPAFFDIMVHLAIHLLNEALLAGPVQYRWMYPFERYLGKFKRYVRNRARPEGSIAEAYVHVEYLTFCSMYLNDIETRHNREERNSDTIGQTSRESSLSIFSQKVRPLGAARVEKLPDALLAKAEWYVLNNCVEIEDYIDEHYNKMKEEDLSNIERRHQSQFLMWFRTRIAQLHAKIPPEVIDDIYALACGPYPLVTSYSGCIMHGIRFHTKELKGRRHTQNSGVVVHGDHQGLPVDFYGVLQDII